MISSNRSRVEKWRESSSFNPIADELRAISLALKEDEFIGTEETLTRHFGVSGPTLRKAIRLLEHEEVVAVKRGVRGGFFSRRPKMETLSRLAGIYLGGHLDSLDDVPVVTEALIPVLIDAILRSDRLAELEPYAVPRSSLLPYDVFIEEIYKFFALLQEMANNRPLQICLLILSGAGLGVAVGKKTRDKEGQLVAQNLHSKIAQALLSGKRSAAIEYYLEYSRRVNTALKSQLGKPQARSPK